MKKITLIILLFCITIINAQEASYSIKNVSSNTKYQDFGVSYYGENIAVFASSRKDKSIRKRKWLINNQPFLELYKGIIGKDGDITNVKRFSKVLNSKFHESNVSFTKDLKTVYFTRDNYINKRVKKDSTGMILNQLYRAQVGVDGEWTNIESMPFNSDNYQTGHPVLNSDENKLYFVSDMPGSYGKTDIFVVDINSDGTFGEPKNLGSEINTEKREMFPFIDDNNVLYFSSDGFLDSRGGLDIYAAKIIGNEVVEKGINLGMPINSNKDDFSLVYKKGEKRGYFSSNRDGGKGDDDIYSFLELEPVKFDCNQIVEGVVREKETEALLPGALVTLYNVNGEKIESIIADKFASFSFKLDCETPYKVIGSKENYDVDEEVFETSDINDVELALGLTLAPNEFINVRGKLMVNIKPIYFDLDKSEIRPDAAIELEKVIRIMQKYPKLKIDLGSHTDSRAPDLYNLKLSQRRAKSTINWIIDKGIERSRINGKGYGESKLVNKCSNDVKCTDQEHQLNRRSEFVILNPKVVNE